VQSSFSVNFFQRSGAVDVSSGIGRREVSRMGSLFPLFFWTLHWSVCICGNDFVITVLITDKKIFICWTVVPELRWKQLLPREKSFKCSL